MGVFLSWAKGEHLAARRVQNVDGKGKGKGKPSLTGAEATSKSGEGSEPEADPEDENYEEEIEEEEEEVREGSETSVEVELEVIPEEEGDLPEHEEGQDDDPSHGMAENGESADPDNLGTEVFDDGQGPMSEPEVDAGDRSEALASLGITATSSFIHDEEAAHEEHDWG